MNTRESSITTEDLKIIQLRVAEMVESRMGVSLKLEAKKEMLDYMSDRLYVSLMTYIAAEQRSTTKTDVVAMAPLTWLDHLRKEHFPTFLTKKWPIKYKEISYTYVSNTTVLRTDVPVDERDVRAGYKRVHTYSGVKW